ncbi:hypothetical protein [Emticicia fontis]
MRAILLKVITIVIILIVIDKGFGALFNNFIFKKTISGERGGSLNYLLERKKNIDFVILGSSRAKHHINPDSLFNINGEGFNAGINGAGGVIYCSVALEVILKRGINLKTVILQLDSRQFIESNNCVKEMSAIYPFLSESSFLRDYVEQSGWKEKILSNSDFYKFNSKYYFLIFNFFNRNKVKDDNGFSPLGGSLDTSKIINLPLKKIKYESFSDIRLEALKNIISICKKNVIKLYIVLPPNFKELNNEESFYNNILKSSIYQKANFVRVIDMSNIKSFNDLRSPENWKDGGHLNEIGANKFSSYLNDSLLIR